jgi:hypothetical protein
MKGHRGGGPRLNHKQDYNYYNPKIKTLPFSKKIFIPSYRHPRVGKYLPLGYLLQLPFILPLYYSNLIYNSLLLNYYIYNAKLKQWQLREDLKRRILLENPHNSYTTFSPEFLDYLGYKDYHSNKYNVGISDDMILGLKDYNLYIGEDVESKDKTDDSESEEEEEKTKSESETSDSDSDSEHSSTSACLLS